MKATSIKTIVGYALLLVIMHAAAFTLTCVTSAVPVERVQLLVVIHRHGNKRLLLTDNNNGIPHAY